MSDLRSKIFVFTGKLKVSRDDAVSFVQKAGAKTANSISSKTDYLVCGDEPGSKLEKAKENSNINIINENEFLTLLGKI